uniref:Metalloendopeptidase n=1 Tax=Strongyloides venezuelensis TaxID=75913 RepID=A0A0K0FTU6_STRVS
MKTTSILYLVLSYLITCYSINFTENVASLNYREKRAVVRGEKYRWNQRIFLYSVDSSLRIDKIVLGLAMITKRTCLTFVRITKQSERHKAQLLYVRSLMYLTFLGKHGKNPHKIYVPRVLTNPSKVARETLRALGLDYEHNRPDRNNYLDVTFRNIPTSLLLLFYKDSYPFVDTFGLNYDYRSIMHFEIGESCKKKKICMRTKERNTLVESVLGKSNELTFNDAKLTNLQYCLSWLIVKRRKCLHYGYPIPLSVSPNNCVCLPYFTGKLCETPKKNYDYCRTQNVFYALRRKLKAILISKNNCYYYIRADNGKRIKFEIKYLRYRLWNRLCNNFEHVEVRSKDISVSGTMICPKFLPYRFISTSNMVIIHTKNLKKSFKLKLSYKVL